MTLPTALLQIALATVTSGLVLALVNGFFSRHRVSAEAEAISAATARSLLTGANEQLDRILLRLTAVEEELEHTGRRAHSAEIRADRAKYAMETLQRNVVAYRDRVDYLTQLLVEVGVAVMHWTPPRGIEREDIA